MTTAERMMELVQWEILPAPENTDGDLPYATSVGILSIGDFHLQVYQLSNGQRVIDERDLKVFFGLDGSHSPVAPE